MSRKGHREDCQCIICTRIRAKAAREVAAVAVELPVEEVPTFGALKIGELFNYGSQVFKKTSKTMALNISGAEIGDVTTTFLPETEISKISTVRIQAE